MTAAVIRHPRFAELVARRMLRGKIERAVERLLAVLDEIDGDPDFEPWLGAPDASAQAPQWPRSSPDDREQEDEHGGDVLDEPHDAEEDEDDITAEPNELECSPAGLR